jgi:hypothetical protein
MLARVAPCCSAGRRALASTPFSVAARRGLQTTTTTTSRYMTPSHIHATLHKIMLEVALLQAGPKQQWQQGAALCVLARVSRSWRDLAGDDELWRSLCEGPEHWHIQPRASLSLSTSQSVAALDRVGGVGGVTPCWQLPRTLPGSLYVLATPCKTTSAPCGGCWGAPCTVRGNYPGLVGRSVRSGTMANRVPRRETGRALANPRSVECSSTAAAPGVSTPCCLCSRS